MPRVSPAVPRPSSLPKTRTGIWGLDEITGGGLPRGRPTLVCGGAGSGKTLLATEFLVRGALEFHEPGVFMSFEESEAELARNVASLGFNLEEIVSRKLLFIDQVIVARHEIEETGEYDLEGLFVRLGHAIDSVKAKRVVLDTIEALFGGLSDQGILRAELIRLFRWLKDRGVTAVITGERGDGTLTRHGLEEYVSDCVILLDNRVTNELATRRLRIIKYRGSSHGADEYPFIIDEQGFSVLPVTSAGLDHIASTERVSTGLPKLDDMLGGKGYFKGTTILLSGPPGSGKSSLCGHFVEAACRRGERAVYFASEESGSQIMRNMRSIGIELEPWLGKGLLRFLAARPTLQGLEVHLSRIQRSLVEFKPSVAVVDAISDYESMGSPLQVRNMMMRLIDFFKTQQITVVFTTLTGSEGQPTSGIGMSSIFDTWIHLNHLQDNLERNRVLFVMKSRGMATSKQVREFILTDRGAVLKEIYTGPAGAMLGAARLAQEARDEAAAEARKQESALTHRLLKRKKQAMESSITAIRRQFEAEAAELQAALDAKEKQESVFSQDRARIVKQRF
jgi:circadian clock protein KaiC